MDRQLFVYVDLAGRPVLVGRLWTRVRKGNESATFEYDRQWLAHPTRFSLEPALTLGPGPYHTPAGRALFGALGDSAPDRWGRVLMRRAERRRADQEKRSPRTLSEADFLLMVVAEDLEDFSQLLQRKLHRLPGVRQVQSSISLQEFKRFDDLPLPAATGKSA